MRLHECGLAGRHFSNGTSTAAARSTPPLSAKTKLNSQQLEIRDAAASNNGRLAIYTRCHGVRLFALDTGAEVMSFESTTNFGGSRFDISPSGEMIATASYDDGSVAVLDDSGNQLWFRNGLDDIQLVAFSVDSAILFCSHHRGIVSAFHADDGIPYRFSWFKKHIQGSYRLYESPYDDRYLNDRIETSLKLTTKSFRAVRTIKRKTFAILDTAFAPEFFCISESGGPISCYHIDGTEVWELPHRSGVHALDLSYANHDNLFRAITWPYEDGGDQFLLSIRPATGEIINSQKLPDDTSLYFAAKGRMLVSTSGKILDVETIKQIGTLSPT